MRRGAALGTASTLGHAATSDLGPTPDHGFRNGWRDALGVLAAHGVTDVRVTLDWPRLQPRPGALDGDWAEWFEDLLRECDRLGMAAWAVLHDGGVPRWFDDEGAFGDEVAAGRSWPRWVERAAERFGDHVTGWVPLLGTPDHAAIVWRDTWGILRGGPVVARVFRLPDDRRWLDPAAPCDRLGVALVAHPDPDRTGELIRMAAEEGPERPIVVAELDWASVDAAASAEAVDASRAALDDAERDGIPVELAFTELTFDDAGEPTPVTRAWLP